MASSTDSSSMFSNVSSSPLKLFVLALFIYAVWAMWVKKASSPDLPWVARNEKAWVFRNLRARWWCTMNYEEAMKKAYDEYARESKPCILATLDGEVVLLPPSSTPWLISQPENVLSAKAAQKNIFQTRYTFLRPEIMDSTFQFDLFRSESTMQMSIVIPEMCDELGEAVDQVWGPEENEEETDEAEGGTEQDGWRTVVLLSSITKIVARISNRVFVGVPLCRDEEYIKNAVSFADEVPFAATSMRLFPSIIRPLIAPLATRNNRKYTGNLTEILTPEILRQQSLRHSSETKKDVKVKEKDEAEDDEKNDFLQTLLARVETRSRSNPNETDPSTVCARLLHTNLVSVPTTSFIGTNTLLDILASPKSERVLDTLREEAIDTMDADDELWTHNGLTKMEHLDSALRESSRLASIVGVGINQMVAAPGGVTTPEGWHIPKGSVVATHVWGPHHDEINYPAASTYKPFRFVGLRDESPPDAITNAKDNERTKKPQQQDQPDETHLSFAATSPTYLGFGHGRHACPGRFFADQVLKLLLAYLLTRYEIQMVMEGGVGGNWNGKGVRPECWWAGPTHVPPSSAKVRVRRREDFR